MVTSSDAWKRFIDDGEDYCVLCGNELQNELEKETGECEICADAFEKERGRITDGGEVVNGKDNSMKVQFCPECGEVLPVKGKDERGIVKCREHGEIYVDMDP